MHNAVLGTQLGKILQQMVEMCIKAVYTVGACWHNAVLGTQLDKVCYYSITHSAASSQSIHVSSSFDRLPASLVDMTRIRWSSHFKIIFLATSEHSSAVSCLGRLGKYLTQQCMIQQPEGTTN